ncbi:MAG: DUF5677 domain-containing protein [Coriobacteriia bacterium]|nr:DUF5677 domain-containing protein [Coriobacteriia bacterium]
MRLGADERSEERFDELLAAGQSAVDVMFGWLDAGLEFDRTVPAFVGSLFAIRSTRNLKAVQLLCAAGYAVEAQTLLRNMVEDAVTLGYISTKPDKLAKDWLSFENPRLASETDLLAILQEDVPDTVPAPVPERAKFSRWTRLSLFAMAERADRATPGIAEYLEYVYPVLSDRAHGNISSSTSYAKAHPDGTLEALYKPSARQVDITLCNAVTVALTTAERAKALGVDLDLTALEQTERDVYAACGMSEGPPPIGDEG